MDNQYGQIIKSLKEPTESLRAQTPQIWEGFSNLHASAMADGALSTGVKELIALAIAVVKQCDGCIAYHAKAAGRHGVSRDQVAEALGVALLMDGGPASVYGPRAWQAFCELSRPALTVAAEA